MAEQNNTPPSTEGGQVDKGEPTSPDVPYKGKYEKFKTVEDLETSYGELEKELGSRSEDKRRLAELEAFEKQVTPVVNFIWKDEETLKRFRNYATGEQPDGEPKKEPTGKDANLTAEALQVRDLVTSQEGKIVADFEAKYGIDKLEPGSQEDTRKKIGKQMAKWLGGRLKPSLSELPTFLEEAYTLMNAEKVRESGKVEGFVEALRGQSGAIGSMPSSTKKSETVELTAEQKTVARKMGISEADYAKNLQKP